jgi:Putative Ig domain
MRLKRAILFTILSSAIITQAMPASAAYRWKRPRTTNTAPVITGTAPTSVQANVPYAFTPSASDAQNNRLTFSISNKPSWASFSSSTGTLAGTPSGAQAGTYSNIGIRVSDGYLTSSLPTFSILVIAAPGSVPVNTAPAISGTPATSVTAGSAYSFTPKTSDADGNMLAFSVSNKPTWAVFSTATGSLAGTPASTQTGTYSGIAISVSDGTASSTLAAFGITVSAPAPTPATGSATLSWVAPTQNTNGSPLTDLAGFKVYHGTSAAAMNNVIQLQGSSSSNYTFSQLAAGTHYFAVSAYTSGGTEGALSAVGSKSIQ